MIRAINNDIVINKKAKYIYIYIYIYKMSILQIVFFH